MARAKYFFKKFPKLYFVLAYLFGGRQVNTTAQKFVDSLDTTRTIINLGSGTKSLGPHVINVDFHPFPNVQVVARAEFLPFADASVDVIVCDNVLEHVPNPAAVVNEIKRVLKAGGVVYMGVPFIIQYHSSPYDFQRWTIEGTRTLMDGFMEMELKIACGPTSAMTAVVTEWLAIALSFNLDVLYNMWIIVWTVAFAPVKVLDYIFSHYRKAENIAYGFYFIGKKN